MRTPCAPASWAFHTFSANLHACMSSRSAHAAHDAVSAAREQSNMRAAEGRARTWPSVHEHDVIRPLPRLRLVVELERRRGALRQAYSAVSQAGQGRPGAGGGKVAHEATHREVLAGEITAGHAGIRVTVLLVRVDKLAAATRRAIGQIVGR